jgi:hypothetical protein
MSQFTRRFQSQALRIYEFREGAARRPFVRLMQMRGYTYLRIGPVVLIREGWRLIVRGAR